MQGDVYDGFGAVLHQEQPGGSVRSLVFISRATLDSETHKTPPDFEAAFCPVCQNPPQNTTAVDLAEGGGLSLI